ncbi:hypothetical protein GCM10009838_85330 [Catenulispora subtropica]|uniref:ER-bound oxygenase mpaB/mpaB'/Rubber oxygenase catalytic domain-containing protein n=1 Tax=Catenulispora subtropica TaxID=450798 RepID=A0ABN2TEA1_9ACTN
MYRYWRHIGRLLGLEDAVTARIHDHTGAAELLDLLDATTERPDEAGRVLTATLFASTSEGLARVPAPALSASAWRDLLCATARASLGDGLADGLGIQAAPVGEFLPLIAQGLGSARHVHLTNPEEGERARQRHIAIRRQRMVPDRGRVGA